uniref:Chromo domain-containing protein n=1 Tax=Steinernema glaseri TaxID=37863 RepID=A0A1I7YQ58_9BILA
MSESIEDTKLTGESEQQDVAALEEAALEEVTALSGNETPAAETSMAGSEVAETSDEVVDAEEAQVVESGEFIVEAVLKSRKRGRKREFLIKWKNYPDSENTWEPEENCGQCKELIAECRKKEMEADIKKRQSKTARKALIRGPQSASKSKLASRSPSRLESEVSSIISEGKPPAKKRPRLIAYVDSDEESIDKEFDGSSVDEQPQELEVKEPEVKKTPKVEQPAKKAKKRETPKKADTSVINSTASTSIAEAMEEAKELTDGKKLPPDDTYGVYQGQEVVKVLGVSNVFDKEIMAIVQYHNGKFEPVPTRLLHDKCPKVLLTYYESKLKFHR